ncbi:MAG: glycosyl transferase [Gammaproteobacteria bacterium HGW-Gammaproteobacteria-11]|nr:MAG: glycosyl transferase [Gammaproteobacteria bacterium HGW-Gammaproteobacteria-11]
MSALEPQAAPLITVVIPCYNYAEYVGEAVRSVLAQDHQSFELIVVDDGSSDGSVGVIEHAIETWRPASTVQRVKMVCQANAGVSAALNAGLAEARGQFIATFDADDVMPAGRLRVQADYLLQHPEVGCVGGSAVRIDEAGRLLPKKEKKRSVRRYDFAEALANALVVGGNIAMFRRDAIDQVGGYDPKIKIQDFQMTLKVACAGYYIDILPDVVTLYRKHEGSLSKNYKAEYRYGLEVIAPYKDHPNFQAAKAKLITKALRMAVVYDKAFGWSLIKEVPPKYWDAQLFKRLRHLLVKKSKIAPEETLK